MLGDQATAEDIAPRAEGLRARQAAAVQFALWLKEIAHGNLGQSIFLQRPVTQALAERAEPTLFLALLAVAIAALIGVPGGIVSAVWRGRVRRPGRHRPRDAGAPACRASGSGSIADPALRRRGSAGSRSSGYGEPGASLAASASTTWCCRPPCWACSTRR